MLSAGPEQLVEGPGASRSSEVDAMWREEEEEEEERRVWGYRPLEVVGTTVRSERRSRAER